MHKIENYNDNLTFNQPLHPWSKDFILCCLKKNPFMRKNVYKLLQHPFVQLHCQDVSSDLLDDNNEISQINARLLPGRLRS